MAKWLPILILLSGCTMDRQAFHVLNAADAYQTQTFRKHHCLVEGNPLTRNVLGENPEPASTALWFLGGSMLYEFSRDKYQDRAWWPYVSWFLVGSKAYIVSRNVELMKEC